MSFTPQLLESPGLKKPLGRLQKGVSLAPGSRLGSSDSTCPPPRGNLLCPETSLTSVSSGLASGPHPLHPSPWFRFLGPRKESLGPFHPRTLQTLKTSQPMDLFSATSHPLSIKNYITHRGVPLQPPCLCSSSPDRITVLRDCCHYFVFQQYFARISKNHVIV